MKKYLVHTLFLVIWVQSIVTFAQFRIQEVCRVDEGHLVFTIDRRWTQEEKEQVIRQFDLDSLLLVRAFKGEAEIILDGVAWRVQPLDANRFELIKLLESTQGSGGIGEEIILLDDRWISITGELEREAAIYGVNRLIRPQVFRYHQGVATFFLPNKFNAGNIYLSGTFNNWSTSEVPMVRTDTGWMARLELKPGKYLYKYIIDGRWTNDPYNRQREDDTYGGFNSVIFCNNHRFTLDEYPDAHRVVLAGSFNNWNEGELQMVHESGRWTLPIYLRPGTYAYKYIVDGNWILDPKARVSRPDGEGHINSFMSVGDTLYFRLENFTWANEVTLAGDFNNWNPSELYMEKTVSGWELPYVLGHGNYQYKFLVDGKWITDPKNPLYIILGDIINSFLPVEANHAFVLHGYPDAGEVIVTGNFTGWSEVNNRMMKQGDRWIFPIYLMPGKYTYKFIVDGQWMIDPENDLWEQNEYGNYNSVLWIDP